MLNYDNGYWPTSIETVRDDATLRFIEKNLYLMQLPQRKGSYDVFAGKNVNAQSAAKLAASSEAVWAAIRARDVRAWGAATTQCLEAQLEMFPATATDEVRETIERCRDVACGWKLTGAGGGGYLLLISEKPIPGTIQIHVRS